MSDINSESEIVPRASEIQESKFTNLKSETRKRDKGRGERKYNLGVDAYEDYPHHHSAELNMIIATLKLLLF